MCPGAALPSPGSAPTHLTYVFIGLFFPFTFVSVLQNFPNQLEFKLTVYAHLALLICKDNFAPVATFLSFQNVTRCCAVPGCLLRQDFSAIHLWVTATEIPSRGRRAGSLGMIHAPSHGYPGAS